MSIIPALDANGFPVDPVVEDLPPEMTEAERYAFAGRVMAEQGHRIGDYLHAAVTQAFAEDGEKKHELVRRWIEMTDIMEELHGKPITLTYNACARREAERRNVPH